MVDDIVICKIAEKDNSRVKIVWVVKILWRETSCRDWSRRSVAALLLYCRVLLARPLLTRPRRHNCGYLGCDQRDLIMVLLKWVDEMVSEVKEMAFDEMRRAELENDTARL